MTSLRLATPEPMTTIGLFGRLEVRRGEEVWPIVGRKNGAIFGFLALQKNRRHSRELLLELFWPTLEIEPARNNLRVALSGLRKQLTPVGLADRLAADRHHVEIDGDAFVTDVEQFEFLLSGDPTDDALRDAIALYKGPLLAEIDADWISAERYRFQNRYAAALRKLGRSVARQGLHGEAIQFLTKAVEEAPYHEGGVRSLMRAYIDASRPSQALSAYHALVDRLRKDLASRPEPKTDELARLAQSQSAPFAGIGRGPSPAAPDPDTYGKTPMTSTALFGREEAIQDLVRRISEGNDRLISLLGPGGAGKTRLAIEVAKRTQPALGGRVVFVRLDKLTRSDAVADEVVQAAAQALKAKLETLDDLYDELADQRALIVLDNLEHLLGGSHAEARVLAELVDSLVTNLPRATVLATTRQPIGAPLENRIPVEPLARPNEQASLSEVENSPSGALLIDRIRRRLPGFVLDEEAAGHIAALCRSLGGSPLALELAATWVGTLSLSQLVEQLENRFDLLVTESAAFEPRHRSLRSTFDAGYDLLSAEARQFFAWLSIFRAPFTAEMAQEVIDKAEENEQPGSLLRVAGLLSILQDRSLLSVASVMDAGELRLALPESLREYALEKLGPERFAKGMEALFETLQEPLDRIPSLQDPRTKDRMLRKATANHEHYITALDWCLQEGRWTQGLRMVGGLRDVWERGFFRQGRQYSERFLTHPEGQEAIVLARAYHSAGAMTRPNYDVDTQASVTYYAKAYEHYRQAGDLAGLSLARSEAYLNHTFHGEYEEAAALLESAFEEARQAGQSVAEISALVGLGSVHRNQGHFEQGDSYYRQGIAISRANADDWSLMRCLSEYGYSLSNQGRLAEAEEAILEAIGLSRDLNDGPSLGHYLWLLAVVKLEVGSYGEAIALFEESAWRHRQYGNWMGLIYAGGYLAALLVQMERPKEAERWAAERLILARQVRDKFSETQSLGFLADAKHAMGEVETALEYVDRQVPMLSPMGSGMGVTVHSTRSVLLARLGRFDEALESLRNSYRMVRGGFRGRLFQVVAARAVLAHYRRDSAQEAHLLAKAGRLQAKEGERLPLVIAGEIRLLSASRS